MRRILKRHEIVADEWLHFGEAAADGTPVALASSATGSGAVIVPVCELRKDQESWLARRENVGVRICPGESVESLADVLPRVALVAVEFPSVGDGRGFSYGRLLRDRLKFIGEMRAVGAAVKQDKIFLLARCGFDSFELPPGENADEALRALRRYDVVYQPGAQIDAIKKQRFFS